MCYMNINIKFPKIPTGFSSATAAPDSSFFEDVQWQFN